MFAYIINTKDKPEQAISIESAFGKLGITSRRVASWTTQDQSASLPEREETGSRIRERSDLHRDKVDCVQQHLRAYELLLASKENLAVICEDTVLPIPKLGRILDEAAIYSDVWDILRLSGLPKKRSRRVTHLRDGYWLTVSFTRLQGVGAYAINRYAASVLIKELQSSKMPFDQALDQEWRFGLNAASVQPNLFRESTAGGIDRASRKETTRWSGWSLVPFGDMNVFDRFVARSRQLRRARSGYPAMTA